MGAPYAEAPRPPAAGAPAGNRLLRRAEVAEAGRRDLWVQGAGRH